MCRVTDALFFSPQPRHSNPATDINTAFSGAVFFYSHLPAIGKLTLPASESEVTRKTFLTFGQ
ncbi:hypothetical protein CBF16_22820 (plasmid) [Pantoea agglomerans]|nr:hypothetical protein CBF16_22820 [Pantoea agglomerans]